MRSVPSQFLKLLLCLLLMPGWTEVIENVEHVLHDGHPAHFVEHDDGEDEARHDDLEAEHGCTPVSHTCPCHASIPAILSDCLTIPRVHWTATLRDRPPTLTQHPMHRANAPPVPPPRA